MEKLYKTALACGLIPFISLVAFLFLGLTFQFPWMQTATLPIVSISIIFVLVGFYSLSRFFTQAKRKQSQKNISRVLMPFLFLIVSLPLIVITYFTTQYISTSHTVVIENNSDKTIKRLFFSNGDEKYFVRPIEPNEKFTKALLFETPGKVDYSLTLDNKTLTGTIFYNITVGVGTTAHLTVTRTEKVITKE